MAITIDVQDNPVKSAVGKIAGEATIIYSGYTSNQVTYQIKRADGTQVFNVESTVNLALKRYATILALSSTKINIILPFRTKFKVRVRRDLGAWSDWTSFKTRDKLYQLPGAISHLSDNKDDYATRKTSVTYTITNGAKATVTETNAGARVVNTDYGYVATTNIAYTRRGATITNSA